MRIRSKNAALKEKHMSYVGKEIGFFKVHSISDASKPMADVTCKCGKRFNISVNKLGRQKSCGCSYMRKRGKHSNTNYFFENNIDAINYKLNNAEVIICLNNLDRIKLFNDNPNDESLDVIRYKSKRILLLPGEVFIPHRLVKRFLKEVPLMKEWLQEYIHVRLSGMVTTNEKDDYVSEQDLLKYLIKK